MVNRFKVVISNDRMSRVLRYFATRKGAENFIDRETEHGAATKYGDIKLNVVKHTPRKR